MQRAGEYEGREAAVSLNAGPKLIPVDYDPFNGNADPESIVLDTDLFSDPNATVYACISYIPPLIPVTVPPNFAGLAPIVSNLRDRGVRAHVIDEFLEMHGTTLDEVRACAPRQRAEFYGKTYFVPAGSTEAEIAEELEFQEYAWARLFTQLGQPTPWGFH